jgi:hypothetical protein
MKHIPLTLLALIACISTAEAAPSYQSARKEARSIIAAEKKFEKLVAKLSAADREKLKAALAKIDDDSDGDGSSDLYEFARGSSRCDADSDDDGIDDGEDQYEDSRDGDGDGHDDTNEVKAKGRIVSFADPTLVVADKTFNVTPQTTFRGRNFSKASLVAGTCVEAEGHLEGGIAVADKIELEDSCRN